MSLKRAAVSGLIWTSLDTILLKGVSFFATLLLARILGPEEFGLVGMIAVCISLGNLLVDSGFSTSLLRSQSVAQRDYSTIFFCNIFASIVFYWLSFFIAPLIAMFFKQEILTKVVRFYSIGFFFTALSSVHTTILRKQMKFKLLMFLNLPATLLGLIVAFAAARSNQGVWSLVYLFLTTQLVQTALVWIFAEWKPSFEFSFHSLALHFSFGYKLLLAGILNISFGNIYNILIGRYYSVTSLGLYERAFTVSEYPVQVITGIVDKVAFPILAGIQNDRERVAEIYRKMIKASFFLSAPMMLGAASLAVPGFDLVLGKEWRGASRLFQILCLGSMFYPVQAFNIILLKVYGRSDLFLQLELVKKLTIIVGLAIGFKFGIDGLVWSIVFTSLIALVINSHYSGRLIDYRTSEQLLDIAPTLAISLLTAFGMYIISIGVSYSGEAFQIIFSSAMGSMLYLLLSMRLNKQTVGYAIHLLRGFI